MKRKIYIKTWGCQMNEYDSSMITGILTKDNQYVITKYPDRADVLILNTCSIREKAQEKLFHQLGRWKYLKEKNKNLIIAVGGCVATQEGKEIYKRAQHVNVIFGTQTLHRLPKMIKSISNGDKKNIIDIAFPEIEKFDYLPRPYLPNVSSYISIMEGCNKYCSFCIVPYTRGKEVSRPCDDIIFEAVLLSKKGVREINLLGQNVNSYQGKTFDGKICKFSELLRLIAEIKGIDRIRFTTSNPIEFTDDIIDVYRDTPKLVSFLHLPVQSGSNRILKLMKRAHTVEEYKNIIKKLNNARPNIQISSDFIVGFPGETEEDFQDTLKLINDVNFDMSYSFLYSPRPGTPASNLYDNVTKKEKKRRLYILQDLINKKTEFWNKKIINTTQSILVEGISKKNIMKLYGKTEYNRIVHFTGNHNMIGKFVNLKITHGYRNSLQGKCI